jgi:hypothetical protein
VEAVIQDESEFRRLVHFGFNKAALEWRREIGIWQDEKQLELGSSIEVSVDERGLVFCHGWQRLTPFKGQRWQ